MNPVNEGEEGTAWLVRHGTRIAAALFGLAVLLALWNLVASGRAQERVAAQNEVIFTFERLLSAARDMETGSRGYLLAGSDDYLAPYRDSLAQLGPAETAAREAWRRDGGRPEMLGPMFDVLERKRAYTVRLVEARQAGGVDPARALVASGEGKALMDALRVEVGRFQDRARARRPAQAGCVVSVMLSICLPDRSVLTRSFPFSTAWAKAPDEPLTCCATAL